MTVSVRNIWLFQFDLLFFYIRWPLCALCKRVKMFIWFSKAHEKALIKKYLMYSWQAYRDRRDRRPVSEAPCNVDLHWDPLTMGKLIPENLLIVSGTHCNRSFQHQCQSRFSWMLIVTELVASRPHLLNIVHSYLTASENLVSAHLSLLLVLSEVTLIYFSVQ